MNRALIVIDVQKYFLKGFSNKKVRAVTQNIQKHLSKNLSGYKAVYFTIFKNDKSSPLWNISRWKGISNKKDWEPIEEIKQFVNKDNLFYKNILSAYKVPGVKNELVKNNIKEVDLCGFDTDCCVLATAYDLFDSGIKPVILKDLTWSTSKDDLNTPTLKIVKRNIGFVK